MKTIKINNPDKVNLKTIEDIASAILNGKIVILPTATIYGISCAYNNKKALQKVYEIKKRDASLPFIVLISKLSTLNSLVENISPQAKTLIDCYWDTENPSPLTIIFEKNKSLNSFITSRSTKIAIRRAGLKFIRQVIDISGPIISTSASISGQGADPVTIDGIPVKIRTNADLIVSCQNVLAGTESTIIDTTGINPVIIREGKIKHSKIQEILNIKGDISHE